MDECKPLVGGEQDPRADGGRAVQVDSFKTSVESAYGFSA